MNLKAVFATLLVSTSITVAKQVTILIDSELQSQIHPSVEDFMTALNHEGYTTKLVETKPSDCPADIRSQLIKDFETNQLEGVIVIGQVPCVYFAWKDPTVAVDWYRDRGQRPGYDVFPTYYYFSNLQGTWEGLDTFGNYTLISGSNLPDVWIGILRADQLSGTSEATALKQYFKRNLDYRSAPDDFFPNRKGLGAFLVRGFDEWSNEWRSLGQMLTQENLDIPGIPTHDDYLSALQNPEGYLVNYFVGAVFWDPEKGFYAKADGRLYLNQIIDSKPKIGFYSLVGCCTSGNFEAEDYWSGSLVFNTPYGLATLAAALNDGGTMRDNDVWTRYFAYLRMGLPIGKAFLKAMESFDIETPTYRSGSPINNTIIGDPTLRLHYDRTTGNEIAHSKPATIGNDTSLLLTDASLKTTLSYTPNDQGIIIDFETDTTFKALLILWDNNEPPESLVVSISDHINGPWKTLAETAGIQSSSTEVFFDGSIAARYLSLQVIPRNKASVSIKEVMVFE